MRKTTFALAAVMALGTLAARADARGGGHVRYVGVHPVVAEYGGGFCYIEFPHVHVYEPQRPDVLYRPHDDGHHFVGDPVPYGYEGPKHAYYGHHPIDVDFVVGDDGDHTEYCYLEGPHYHPYGPPPEGHFALKGGVYFYAGDFPRVYTEARPRYAKINAVYRPLRYSRPVVVVSPPPEYHGPVVVEEPTTVVVPAHVGVGVGAGVSAGVHAEAGIGVHAGVSIGLPSVHLVAPAIVVEEPPPNVIVVRDRGPRTVVVHDHGPRVLKVKHKGGRGHGKGRWK
jgi:hypothetical protein